MGEGKCGVWSVEALITGSKLPTKITSVIILLSASVGIIASQIA